MRRLDDFILGIPNGSLFEPTMDLLKKVGIKVHLRGRSFEVEISGIKIFNKAYLMRPQDIPLAIEKGIIDCGICGWDCVVESSLGDELETVVELNYSKTLERPAQVVVFSKRYAEIVDLSNVTVTTEYPNMTAKIFPNIAPKNIHFSHGTTEAKVLAGMYDYGVCVTETGRSIRDNNLNIIRTILVSPIVLVVKELTPKISIFGKMLQGALYARKFQLITMNAGIEVKEKIVQVLPSLKSPTISSLENGGYSISTVVEISKLANLLMKLKSLGATNILGTDINYII